VSPCAITFQLDSTSPLPATYDSPGSPSIRAIFECCRPHALKRAHSCIPHFMPYFRHQYIQEHFSNCVISLFLNILLAKSLITHNLCKPSLSLTDEKLVRTIPRTCGRHVIWSVYSLGEGNSLTIRGPPVQYALVYSHDP